MNFFDYFNFLNYNIVRRKLFRREVETAYYSNRKFNLPKLSLISVNDFRRDYPFKFYTEEDRNDFLKAFLKTADENKIILQAEKILQNKYNILGSGEVCFGDKINWNYDYNGKYEWTQNFPWQVNFFDFPKGVDIKYTWELARFHQGITLGKAYLITGNEIYANKFLDIFTSFITSNPYCKGVNWVNSSEVSIRLLNVIFSFAFFIPSAKIDENIINSFIDFVLYHSAFIENNLEYTKKRGDEYLANLIALAGAGIVLKDSYYGKKLLNFARTGLEQEIRSEIHNDGVSYEQSVPFHSVILEIFYLGKIILKKAEIEVSEIFKEKLYKMFEVQSAYLRNDFSIPAIGDMISSRIINFTFEEDGNNFSYPMPVGAFLFKEGKFKKYSPAGTDELLFLFGSKAIEEYLSIKSAEESEISEGFEKGGHYIFKNKDIHLFIEAGEIGRQGEGAHGHNDIFSFDLFYKGKNIISDPGTYSYYADPELRNKLRSVKYHNTICIDNEFLSEFDGPFKIKEDLTRPKILDWVTNETEDILSAQHYAYTRFVDPVIVKRTFHFIKEKNIIKIKDEFLGGKEHKAFFNIYFHPDVTINKISENRFSAVNGEIEIVLNFFSLSDYFVINLQDAEFSNKYGNLTTTKKLNIVIKEKFPAFILTEIFLNN